MTGFDFGCCLSLLIATLLFVIIYLYGDQLIDLWRQKK